MPALVTNVLCYGDNLDLLRRYLPDASVGLVSLEPPFNSNRDYTFVFRDESRAGNPHVGATALLRQILAKVRAGLAIQADFKLRLLTALAANESWDGQHASIEATYRQAAALLRTADLRPASANGPTSSSPSNATHRQSTSSRKH